MSGFEMAYDSEEDVLEVTFETFDEHFAKTIPLGENVIIYTDLMLSSVWGLTLYKYVETIEDGEIEIDSLKKAEISGNGPYHALLKRQPISLFMELIEEKPGFARYLAPCLDELILG